MTTENSFGMHHSPSWYLVAPLSFLCLHSRCSSRAPKDRLRWRIRGGIRNVRGPQRVTGLRGPHHLRYRLRLQPHVPCQAPPEAGREEALQPGGNQQAAVSARRHENTRKLHFPPDSVAHPGGATLEVKMICSEGLFITICWMPHSTFDIFPWELCDKISYFFKLSTALITFWMIMMCRKEFLEQHPEENILHSSFKRFSRESFSRKYLIKGHKILTQLFYKYIISLDKYFRLYNRSRKTFKIDSQNSVFREPNDCQKSTQRT